MEKLIGKVEKLKNCLDNCDIIKDLNVLNEKINKDKELVKLLNDYSNNPNEDLKKIIMNNPLFQEYKDKETDLNILILKINKELKKINSKDKCC